MPSGRSNRYNTAPLSCQADVLTTPLPRLSHVTWTLQHVDVTRSCSLPRMPISGRRRTTTNDHCWLVFRALRNEQCIRGAVADESVSRWRNGSSLHDWGLSLHDWWSRLHDWVSSLRDWGLSLHDWWSRLHDWVSSLRDCQLVNESARLGARLGIEPARLTWSGRLGVEPARLGVESAWLGIESAHVSNAFKKGAPRNSARVMPS